MREEFKHLFEMFQRTQQGKPVNLDDMLHESVAFFDTLKETFKGGSEEEKKEIIRVMNEMYAQLSQQTKALCEKSGLNEDQLFSFCDNPNNFTEEQWQAMQETRKKLFASGKEVSKYLRGKGAPPPSGEKKKGKTPRKPKKDRWLPS